jgi:hypothetical protein
LDKANISKTLSSARAVPTHEAFHFYRGLGDPTGEVATSLGDFFEKLRTIDVRSIEFHFQRQDFEKWIKDVVHDDELCSQISGISKKAHGEELREQIMKVVKGRLEELARAL